MSKTDRIKGIDSMDQSNDKHFGCKRSQKLNTGRYKKVNNLVIKQLQSAAGLSAEANVGAFNPIKYNLTVISKNPAINR